MTAAPAIQPDALDVFDSPVGPLIAGAREEAICLLSFAAPEEVPETMRMLREHTDAVGTLADSPVLQALQSQLREYFACERQEFDVPVRTRGSSFQEQVWAALRGIPYGVTCSYLDIARRIGDPLATRAVGMANNQNPIAIVIPCHRVINADGKAGGYGGGLDRKHLLLDLEAGQGRLTF